MNKFRGTPDLVTISSSLPMRRGKRPITIGSPLHVQCGDHGDEKALRHLLDEVIGWPHIEEGPLSLGTQEMVSLQVAEDVATADPSVFITGREFCRVLFTTPTIYLALPLSSAHWAIVRGWAEPHSASSSGVIPPGVMVVYTPRDEREVTVMRSLLWVSYNFSLSERRKNSADWHSLWFSAAQFDDVQEELALAV
jgi:hypothetical protein